MQRIKQIYTNLISRDQSKSVSSAFYSAFKLLILNSSLLIICTLFTLHLFAQEPEYPDSGFTNKDGAKNLTINGKKEGKWVKPLVSYNVFSNDSNHLTDTNGYVLFVFKGGILNGKARGYRMNGVLAYDTRYLNGKENGACHIYYKSGKLSSAYTMKNGKTEGIFTDYYEDGIIRDEAQYIAGHKNGSDKVYFDDGVLKCDTPYKNDIKDGLQRCYYENGKIASEIVYRNDSMMSIKSYKEK